MIRSFCDMCGQELEKTKDEEELEEGQYYGVILLTYLNIHLTTGRSSNRDKYVLCTKCFHKLQKQLEEVKNETN